MTVFLLGMLAAGGTWAQAPATTQIQRGAASDTQPAKETAKTLGTSAKPETAHKAESGPPPKAIQKANPGKKAAKRAASKASPRKHRITPKKKGKPRGVSKPSRKAKSGKKAAKRAAKKPRSKKRGIAPRKASKPRVISKAHRSHKATPRRPKRGWKAKSSKPAPVRKPDPVAAPEVSMVLPATPALSEPKPPEPRVLLGEREAEARYRDGLALEQRGEMQAAVMAYREAGESGHGPAQKKMGDLYGTGNDVVKRDYETSLRWYDRARKQGIEIPQPFTYPGVRR